MKYFTCCTTRKTNDAWKEATKYTYVERYVHTTNICAVIGKIFVLIFVVVNGYENQTQQMFSTHITCNWTQVELWQTTKNFIQKFYTRILLAKIIISQIYEIITESWIRDIQSNVAKQEIHLQRSICRLTCLIQGWGNQTRNFWFCSSFFFLFFFLLYFILCFFVSPHQA